MDFLFHSFLSSQKKNKKKKTSAEIQDLFSLSPIYIRFRVSDHVFSS